MKKIITLTIILFSSIILWGQNKSKEKPFIIQGQITNCPEKSLNIFFRDTNGKFLTDTINLDATGKFYLRTNKLTVPQLTNIQQNNIQINNIFVAPGYNLTITGNGTDFLSLFKSKTISGIGSESNKFQFMFDSICCARKDTTKWYELKENELLSFIDISQKLKDSIYHVVFDKKPILDRYLKYFGKMVSLDNKFGKINLLVSHVNMNNYSYEHSVSLIKNNVDHTILKNIYKPEYLMSNEYRDGFITNEWLNYLVSLDFKKDSTLRNKKDYILNKISTTYQGKVKEFVLFTLMESAIMFCNSFNDLNNYKKQFKPYISNFESKFYKSSLEDQFLEKEKSLMRIMAGQSAPTFTLENNLGKTISLEDFRGKVIYLDLWASWCGPCREETPNLKLLYDKYKNNTQVVFISIAVYDGINQWKKAIKEDKPDWIQLIDRDGIVAKSYIALAIPKFVLIDKKGNIVDFDAPRPSETEEIEKLLKREIEK